MKCRACGTAIAGVHYCGECREAVERIVAAGGGFGYHETDAGWYAAVREERG